MTSSNYPTKSGLAAGFTLVELMVTLAILMVITVGVIIQFQTLSPNQTLENASDIFRSTFVDMRTGVVAHQKCCGDIIPDGYGLIITLDGKPDNTILLFADLDGDHVYTSSSDQLISTTVLPDNVDITECSTPTSSVTAGICTVVLTTGSASSLYYTGSAASETITFTLTEARTSSTETLNIYPTGFVIE